MSSVADALVAAGVSAGPLSLHAVANINRQQIDATTKICRLILVIFDQMRPPRAEFLVFFCEVLKVFVRFVAFRPRAICRKSSVLG